MTRTRTKGKNAAQCSPEAFDVHTAQLQCLAAVNQAWSPDAATDEERLLVAIARACIRSSLIKNGEAFEISRTCSSVVNTAKQSTETSYKDSKLKTILQLPLISKAFSLVSGRASGRKIAIHMDAVLPNASQDIRSMLPAVPWSPNISDAGPAPDINKTTGSQQQNDCSLASAQANSADPVPDLSSPHAHQQLPSSTVQPASNATTSAQLQPAATQLPSSSAAPAEGDRPAAAALIGPRLARRSSPLHSTSTSSADRAEFQAMAHVTPPWDAFGDAANTVPLQCSPPTRFTGGLCPSSILRCAVDSNVAMLPNAGSSRSRRSTHAQREGGDVAPSASHHTSGVIIAPPQDSNPLASHQHQQHPPQHATNGVIVRTSAHNSTPANTFQQSQNRASYPANGVLIAAPTDNSLPSATFQQFARATGYPTVLVAASAECSPSTNRVQQPEHAPSHARTGNDAPSDAHQHSTHAELNMSQHQQHAAAALRPSNGVAPRNAWAQQSDPALVDGSLQSLLQMLPDAIRVQVQAQLLQDNFSG